MNYFPMSLAGGKAFCNRTRELKRIRANLEDGNPTLLLSPRRYGKTSLALRAFELIRWPYAHVDLYKALSEQDISRYILNGVGQLLGQMESTPKKVMKIAAEFFSGFQLKFVLEQYGVAVEFGRKSQPPVELVLMALERLDVYAKKCNKKVILFLDEFQVVAEVCKNSAMEAAIREAVQKASHVQYIFSGSHRHLIEAMFQDKRRPFYKLCDLVSVKRIEQTHYRKYINKAAKIRWHKPLSDLALERLFQLTEQHAYYVNKICSLAWLEERLPTEEDFQGIWEEYTLENKSSVEKELSLLSLNQRKLLICLAHEAGVQLPFSQRWVSEWKMPTASIQRAMQVLLEKDYVLINESGEYVILDPMIKSVLER